MYDVVAKKKLTFAMLYPNEKRALM